MTTLLDSLVQYANPNLVSTSLNNQKGGKKGKGK